MYLQVIDAIMELDFGASECKWKHTQHQASQYFIEEGKLWRLGGGVGVQAQLRRECIMRMEVHVKVAEVYTEQGHFHRDSIKLILMDKFHSPRLDESILKAIADCTKCKGFGLAHLHSLLQPVIR
jgi:hypothetical protein